MSSKLELVKDNLAVVFILHNATASFCHENDDESFFKSPNIFEHWSVDEQSKIVSH